MTKKCPYCFEEIQSEANKCKHCGEWLTKTDIVGTAKNTVGKALLLLADQIAFLLNENEQVYKDRLSDLSFEYQHQCQSHATSTHNPNFGIRAAR